MPTSHPDASSPRTSAARRCLAVVLAAGEGMRMRSSRPKVLHEVAGRSIAGSCTRERSRQRRRLPWWSSSGRVATMSPLKRRRDLRQTAPSRCRPSGSARPMRCSPRATRSREGFDDVAGRLRRHAARAAETLAGCAAGARGRSGAWSRSASRPPTRPATGALHRSRADDLLAIREHKDASDAERAVRSAMPASWRFDGRRALGVLEAIGNENAAREYYLTDIVDVARRGGRCGQRRRGCAEDEVDGRQRPRPARRGRGRSCSAAAPRGHAGRRHHDRARDRVPQPRHEASAATCWSSPNVVFGPGVTVEERRRDPRLLAIWKARRSAPGATVGPLRAAAPGRRRCGARPRSATSSRSRTPMSARAPRSATSPMSATRPSAPSANIGAGTITCNYDGFGKYRTVIGAGRLRRLELGARRAGDDRRRAPMSAPARVITQGRARPMRSRSRAGQQVVRPGWAITLPGRVRPRRTRAEVARSDAWSARASCSGDSSMRSPPLRYSLSPNVIWIERPTASRTRPVSGRSEGRSGMCGIVGILGQRHRSRGLIVDALKRLEYRGYDSAGIATLEGGQLERRRAEGKLRNLEARLAEQPLDGSRRHRPHALGDAWPPDRDATPIPTPPTSLAVVHNGIIENFRELREELEARRRPVRDRDRHRGRRPARHARAATAEGSGRGGRGRACTRLRGAFALAFLFDGAARTC